MSEYIIQSLQFSGELWNDEDKVGVIRISISGHENRHGKQKRRVSLHLELDIKG